MSGPELCPRCKGLHFQTSPCVVRVTKSTAARKDVHDMRSSIGSGGVSQITRSFSGASRAEEAAGTQALPVDTNSPEMASEQPQAHGSSPCMDQGKIGGPQPTVQLVTAGETALTKRGRGRPRIITDMRAYKAMKQREYRARKK